LAIAYAFRPGESGVRLSYRIPYPGNKLSLRNVSPYSVGRLIVAAPPTVQISGDGLQSAGQDQGFTVYVHDAVAANAPVAIAISGTAPMPASNPGGGAPAGAESAGAPADAGQNPSVNSRQDAGGAESSVTATTMPARLDSLKWIIVAGFAAVFALGFVYLLRRPPVTAAGVLIEVPAAEVPRAVAATASASGAVAAAGTVADVNREVRGSLDELKDSIFRLELRHQAGTITEQDYARERERLQQVLRDLVRG
jgi:hypothetical protein